MKTVNIIGLSTFIGASSICLYDLALKNQHFTSNITQNALLVICCFVSIGAGYLFGELVSRLESFCMNKGQDWNLFGLLVGTVIDIITCLTFLGLISYTIMNKRWIGLALILCYLYWYFVYCGGFFSVLLKLTKAVIFLVAAASRISLAGIERIPTWIGKLFLRIYLKLFSMYRWAVDENNNIYIVSGTADNTGENITIPGIPGNPGTTININELFQWIEEKLRKEK
jgi:hypothetical protein